MGVRIVMFQKKNVEKPLIKLASAIKMVELMDVQGAFHRVIQLFYPIIIPWSSLKPCR